MVEIQNFYSKSIKCLLHLLDYTLETIPYRIQLKKKKKPPLFEKVCIMKKPLPRTSDTVTESLEASPRATFRMITLIIGAYTPGPIIAPIPLIGYRIGGGL